MNILFRKTTADDIYLYKQCFENDEFLHMLYHGERVNLTKYLLMNGNDRKFVVSVRGNNIIRDIGFTHFYQTGESAYTYVGGLHPDLFNSGIGIYASIAILSYMFDENPNYVFTTGVYNDNIRSMKMVKALGFEVKETSTYKSVFWLNLQLFDNATVSKIKDRITYKFV